MRTLAALILTIGIAYPVFGQSDGGVLANVKIVSVAPTVLVNPDKVRDPTAALAAEQALKQALVSSGFEIGEAPVRVHIALEEFSGGNAVKRSALGFGSGRGTVAGRLIVEDDSGRELSNLKIKARGGLLFSGYQSDQSQQRHAMAAFDKKLAEAVASLR
jgi:hypothetical protein